MLAASTIRVAITNFIDTSALASPPSPLHRLDLFFSFPLFSFCLLLLPTYLGLHSVSAPSDRCSARRLAVYLRLLQHESPEVADNW